MARKYCEHCRKKLQPKDPKATKKDRVRIVRNMVGWMADEYAEAILCTGEAGTTSRAKLGTRGDLSDVSLGEVSRLFRAEAKRLMAGK